MIIKTCIKCGFIGEESLFKKNGNICKKCHNLYNKLRYDADPEKYKNKSKEYRKNNPEKIKQEQKTAQKKYKEKHPDKIKERQLISNEKSKIFRKNNPEITRENDKKYHLKHKEKAKITSKIYRENNKEKIKQTQRKCDNERKDKRNEYNKNKRQADIIFRIRRYISSNIATKIKSNGSSKNGESSSNKLLHTYTEIRIYIENSFSSKENLDNNGLQWMSWNNQGVYRINLWKDNDYSTHKWHIDHNIPQSWLPYFSMNDFNFKICWHKFNLHALSAKENVKQNNKKNVDDANKLKDLIEKDIKDNFNCINPFYDLYLDESNILHEVIKTNFILEDNNPIEIVYYKEVDNEKISTLKYTEFISKFKKSII